MIYATRVRTKSPVRVRPTEDGVEITICNQRFLLDASDAYGLCDAVTDALEGSE